MTEKSIKNALAVSALLCDVLPPLSRMSYGVVGRRPHRSLTPAQ